MQPGEVPGWRVGQLAELTGVTVRTLRHYDQTGLLHPSGQTSGGHRLYDHANVVRLYRILALRRLRFSLAEIRSLLDDPDWDLARTGDTSPGRLFSIMEDIWPTPLGSPPARSNGTRTAGQCTANCSPETSRSGCTPVATATGHRANSAG